MSSEVANAARYLITGLKTGALDESQVDKLVRAVGATQRGATPEESAKALGKLAEGLELPDTASAEIAARVLGAMIEAGHDPRPAREPMLACLRRVLPLCTSLAEVVRPQVGEPPPGMSEYAASNWVSRRANEALRREATRMGRGGGGGARGRRPPPPPPPAPRPPTCCPPPRSCRTSTRRPAGWPRCSTSSTPRRSSRSSPPPGPASSAS